MIHDIPMRWERLRREIRAGAIRKGYRSIKALAEAAGVSENGLREWLDDPRRFKMGNFAKVCKVTGIDTACLKDVLEGEDETR